MLCRMRVPSARPKSGHSDLIASVNWSSISAYACMVTRKFYAMAVGLNLHECQGKREVTEDAAGCGSFPLSVVDFAGINGVGEKKVIVVRGSGKGSDTCDKRCKGLKDTREASHIKRAGHEEAIDGSCETNVGSEMRLCCIRFCHCLAFATEEAYVKLKDLRSSDVKSLAKNLPSECDRRCTHTILQELTRGPTFGSTKHPRKRFRQSRTRAVWFCNLNFFPLRARATGLSQSPRNGTTKDEVRRKLSKKKQTQNKTKNQHPPKSTNHNHDSERENMYKGPLAGKLRSSAPRTHMLTTCWPHHQTAIVQRSK